GYGIRKMNWVRNPSAYESMVSWREKRKTFQEKYEANLANVVSALQTAWVDAGYNIGQIAANRAIKRIQEEAKAKQEKLQAQLAAENTRPYQPTYSKITESGSVELAGGTKVDLNSNTLTMSNGTVIDLTTGLKKVDVTV
ncbi:MAG: hypothetical protein AB7V13_28185, partial [Pseudorhodoplanes sp.]